MSAHTFELGLGILNTAIKNFKKKDTVKSESQNLACMSNRKCTIQLDKLAT